MAKQKAQVEDMLKDIDGVEEYPFESKIRDKSIKFRSWKIKDKKNYLSCTALISDDNTPEQNQEIVKGIRKNLVLNCIEDGIAITPDEYQFLLVEIRSKSINHKIELELNCDNCKQDFYFELNLKDAIKTDVSNFKTIVVDIPKGTLRFKMGRIKSQDVYDNYMSKSQSEFEGLFVDLVQHVQNINGKIYSSEDTFKLFNTIDVNVFEQMIKQWEPQRFKIDNTIDVVCSKCSHSDKVIVDDIPGFFPLSWTD